MDPHLDAQRRRFMAQYTRESNALDALRDSTSTPVVSPKQLSVLQEMVITCAASTDSGVQSELLLRIRQCRLPVELQRWIAVTEFPFGGGDQKSHAALQVVRSTRDACLDHTLNFLDRMVEYGMRPEAVRFHNPAGLDEGGLLDAAVSAPSGNDASTGGSKTRIPELIVKLIDLGCDPARVSEARSSPISHAV